MLHFFLLVKLKEVLGALSVTEELMNEIVIGPEGAVGESSREDGVEFFSTAYRDFTQLRGVWRGAVGSASL